MSRNMAGQSRLELPRPDPMWLSLAACRIPEKIEIFQRMTAQTTAIRPSDSAQNPLLAPWIGAFQVPRFGEIIQPEHFVPAFEQAMAEHNAEIDAIAANPRRRPSTTPSPRWSAPGAALSRVSDVFYRARRRPYQRRHPGDRARNVAAARRALQRDPPERRSVPPHRRRSCTRPLPAVSTTSRRGCWSAITPTSAAPARISSRRPRRGSPRSASGWPRSAPPSARTCWPTSATP